jgi:hypothetical protein
MGETTRSAPPASGPKCWEGPVARCTWFSIAGRQPRGVLNWHQTTPHCVALIGPRVTLSPCHPVTLSPGPRQNDTPTRPPPRMATGCTGMAGADRGQIRRAGRAGGAMVYGLRFTNCPNGKAPRIAARRAGCPNEKPPRIAARGRGRSWADQAGPLACGVAHPLLSKFPNVRSGGFGSDPTARRHQSSPR